MAQISIIHNRKKCIGCGVCAAACPNNWKMDKDGKASPMKTRLSKVGCNEKAAKACPVKIIKIIKK